MSSIFVMPAAFCEEHHPMLARKQLGLALAIGSLLIVIVLLANSLSSVRLRAGTFVPDRAIEGSGGMSAVASLDGPNLIVVLIMAVVACIGLYFLIQDKKERTSLLQRIALMVGIAALALILRSIVSSPTTEEVQEIEPIAAPTTVSPDLEVPELLPPPEAAPAESTALFISATILILFAAVGWLIWRHYAKPAVAVIESPLDRLGQEARAAADALEQGAEIKSVVMRCYRQMSDVLDEARGLRRKRAMTPREFEEVLVAAGLPSKPVQRLTRLFELARYSHNEVGVRQQQEAISSLIAIAEACGVTEIDGQPI